MEAIFELGDKLANALVKEKVSPGDIISIDKSRHIITKLGKSSNSLKNFDAVSQVYINN